MSDPFTPDGLARITEGVASGGSVTGPSRTPPQQHRRRFIGPMPERAVVRLTEGQAKAHKSRGLFTRSRGSTEEDAGVRDAIREHALQFFLGHGGRKEDWGENQERRVREEMYRRYRQSEWGRARERKREAKYDKTWVGTSFDVGVFLGVDVLGSSVGPVLPQNDAESGPSSRPQVTRSSTAAETFVTAPSMPIQEGPSYLSVHGATGPGSEGSTTPLLQEQLPHIRINDTAWSSTRIPSTSHHAVRSEEGVSPAGSTPKGKGKTVHYADEEPAPPGEVLERRASEVQDTSAGAAWQATAENQVQWGDVIMRDRMLVQIYFTDDQSLPANFDEAQHRVTQRMQYIDWQEFIVAWRKDRLELYTDHSIPCKEWIVGHKRLAFVIPLTQKTKLSLYSFADAAFCLSCPPSNISTKSGSAARWLFLGSRRGTNVFIFNVKARSRALDWTWQLWHHLGGQLPTSVEIRVPALETRLKVDIPGADRGDIQEAFSMFTPQNIVEVCKTALHNVEDYEEIVLRSEKDGISLGLSWRMDMQLDWVWQTEDVEGRLRGWAVLLGLALKQGKQSPHLELRLEQHSLSRIRLKDGTRLDEPPTIEGYLDRIRPASQLKTSMYLSTHDGYIFFTSAVQALPPPPPGAPPPSGTGDVDPFRRETLRGAQQIIRASGMTDLRSILVVRRAFQMVPRQREDVAVQDPMGTAWEDEARFWAQTESFPDDHDDIGGEEGLTKAADRGERRLRRCFELVLTTGHVVRFEAYSCQHALEWIARLRPLISYWKKRHQSDAKTEMDLLYSSTGRRRITPLKHVDNNDDAPPDTPPTPDESSPDLSFLYNWCVLNGCRPITKCGRLFSRRGLRGQFKHVQLILLSGHLVEFRITSTSLYYRRGKTIHLLDAYVCSGYLAAQHLPEGQYNPDSPPLPRRYQDGLESDDRDEDTLFMIWWYHDGSKSQPAENITKVPPLAADRNVAVFRTRSKMERDTWVWAIKAEIEKVVRATPDRESRIRQAGELLST